MENIVFKDREACVANIKFSGDISNVNKVIEEIKSKNPNILDITL